MKAKRTPRNAVEFALYGFMEAISTAMHYQDIWKCDHCHNLIVDTPSAYNEGDKHYCNRDCAYEAELTEKEQ